MQEFLSQRNYHRSSHWSRAGKNDCNLSVARVAPYGITPFTSNRLSLRQPERKNPSSPLPRRDGVPAFQTVPATCWSVGLLAC